MQLFWNHMLLIWGVFQSKLDFCKIAASSGATREQISTCEHCIKSNLKRKKQKTEETISLNDAGIRPVATLYTSCEKFSFINPVIWKEIEI